jgi:hypothetical protein
MGAGRLIHTGTTGCRLTPSFYEAEGVIMAGIEEKEIRDIQFEAIERLQEENRELRLALKLLLDSLKNQYPKGEAWKESFKEVFEKEIALAEGAEK